MAKSLLCAGSKFEELFAGLSVRRKWQSKKEFREDEEERAGMRLELTNEVPIVWRER